MTPSYVTQQRDIQEAPLADAPAQNNTKTPAISDGVTPASSGAEASREGEEGR